MEIWCRSLVDPITSMPGQWSKLIRAGQISEKARKAAIRISWNRKCQINKSQTLGLSGLILKTNFSLAKITKAMSWPNLEDLLYLSSNLPIPVKASKYFPTLRVNLTNPSNGQTLHKGGASLKCKKILSRLEISWKARLWITDKDNEYRVKHCFDWAI